MNLLLRQARSRVAKAAGLCSTDTRVAEYVNESTRRLLPKGYWENTVQRYRICTASSCIVWPRQLQTIEAITVDDEPRKIRNEWYEFLGSGPGQVDTTSGQLDLIDRGQVCAFDDITAGTPAYIRVYSDVAESGKYIILQGYDENGNWVRSLDGAAWIDGIKVAIPSNPASPVTTTKLFSTLARVIKDTTNGVVRLYEWSGTAVVKSLAIYEPDEEVPTYRRSFIPGLLNAASDNTNECQKISVVVMAKLAFYTVANDNDFLLIGCLPALEEMTRALRMYEKNLPEEGMKFEALAQRYLLDELGEEEGSGATVTLNVDPEFGLGMVENP